MTNMYLDKYTITLKKNNEGQLGFRIDSKGNILDIQAGGPAEENGKIEVGDVLIAINGKNIEPEDGIIDLLRSLGRTSMLTFEKIIR